MTYVEILIRTILAVGLLLLIPRILGKQTLSNMTFNDFVTSITLGSLAANLAFNASLRPSYIVLSLIVITAMSFLLSLIALKSRKMRSWISGSPTVLIENGKIMEASMRKIRYTLDSLNQALRERGVFNIEEVEYALLEDNGRISFLKKDAYRLVTKQDMGLPQQSQAFPVELIMDGVVVEDNLKLHGLTREWLEKGLRQKHRGKKLTDVFYAVRGTQQQLVFDFYEDGIEQPLDQE
ncbi:Uncharacterized membrane protein YcaP, DUF421 family [Paenibacillus algorifonticola]|uniref:Uncharacterized membrane protein YcaP, DUF421 family n=1 Tax=Paenibacillus algorifonticola TaxID=684063 RepID=A0A1I2F955_9BACL|nr:DUF421 domain-containing protein [Paenibacillus algorifonticola]SFF01984.1 Uncharacterized membrane protein YcaP, DUF421 family [Paenibacillus algorifonticola]